MEKTNININEIDNIKENYGNLLKKNEDIKNNLRDDNIKISLLNVDSKYRNKNPKNIFESNTAFLPNNPVQTKINSNKVKFFYPNHNFSSGDLIAISNVSSFDVTLSKKLLSRSLKTGNSKKFIELYFTNII